MRTALTALPVLLALVLLAGCATSALPRQDDTGTVPEVNPPLTVTAPAWNLEAAPDVEAATPAQADSTPAPPPSPSGPDATGDAPGGGGATLTAGDSATTLATLPPAGTATLTTWRHPDSAAPNIPTYVSVLCAGTSVYSGTWNTTQDDDPVSRTLAWAGQAPCRLIARAARPSPRWEGTWNAVLARVEGVSEAHGRPVHVPATWSSHVIKRAGEETLDVPEGASGTVSVKLTGCSSAGGTRDATGENLCAGLVRRAVPSRARVSVLDSSGVLASQQVQISVERHHETVTLRLGRVAGGPVRVRVEVLDGAAVVLHGPGSSFNGTM